MIHETGPTRRACLGAGLGLAALVTGCARPPELRVERLEFSDLSGWPDADHDAARAVFLTTQSVARAAPDLGVRAEDWAFDATGRARAMFENAFQPVLASYGDPALFTGYYEPELNGARAKGGAYQTPLYALPDDLTDQPYLTRAEIEAGALAGRGLELVWLDDPVEAFFLQIQGSGRVRLTDGSALRVGFAGKNNHPYRAIGRILVERGEMTVEEASADAIRDWLRAQPDGGAALMNENPSFVFFVERLGLTPETGPIGAMGAPVTAGLSAAVDPAFHPLGAPVWVAAEGISGFGGRLMVAQDIGGAIKGPQRADLFIGSGAVAGRIAGAIRARGRIVTLIPRAAADRLTS